MAISILHVGLPLDHAAIPVEDRPELVTRLAALEASMRALGYDYEIFHASPEGGLAEFRERLRARGCDGVLIGGGVAGDPAMRHFMEQIVDAVQEVVPGAKIMLHTHAEDVRTTVERWFPVGR